MLIRELLLEKNWQIQILLWYHRQGFRVIQMSEIFYSRGAHRLLGGYLETIEYFSYFT